MPHPKLVSLLRLLAMGFRLPSTTSPLWSRLLLRLNRYQTAAANDGGEVPQSKPWMVTMTKAAAAVTSLPEVETTKLSIPGVGVVITAGNGKLQLISEKIVYVKANSKTILTSNYKPCAHNRHPVQRNDNAHDSRHRRSHFVRKKLSPLTSSVRDHR